MNDLGLESGRVRLVAYSPRWPDLYAAESARVTSTFADRKMKIRLEHIGSTAVPGLSAKPIIDIGIALSELRDALFCITPLTELGYACLGEFGIPERIYFRKDTNTPLPGQTTNGVGRTHQIHMYARTHAQS